MKYLIDSEKVALASILLAARAAFLRENAFHQTDNESARYHSELATALLPVEQGGMAIEIKDYLTVALASDRDGSFLREFVNESIRMAFSDIHVINVVAEFACDGDVFQSRQVLRAASEEYCKLPKPIDYHRVFSVDGDRKFPVDLLREFSCVPMTPQDAGRIEQSVQERAGQVGWRIALVRLDMTKPIRAEAWEDAGWKIVGEPLHGGQPESSGEPT
jgi:hypothetical protein